MEHIMIRPADKSESAAIAACVNAAYSIYIQRIGKKPAPMLSDYASLIDKGLVYVLTDQSAGAQGVQGVLVMERQDDALFIENVAVHPAYQGRGLGRALMHFAEQQARAEQLSELRLYTNESMTENLGFYRSLGFEETARRTEHGYRRVFLRKKLALSCE